MTKGFIFTVQPLGESIMADILVWRNVLLKMGIDFYCIVDPQQIVPNWEETDPNVTGHRVDNYTDAVSWVKTEFPGIRLVRVQETEAEELKDFRHPLNACYIIGPDSGAYPNFTRDDGFKIYAPNMFGITVAAIIEYDRFRQGV